MLVAICWFTFVIAMVLVGSVLLVFSPGPRRRASCDVLPVAVSAATGVIGLLPSSRSTCSAAGCT